jgi:octaprenyl-diphosphate synthase
VGKPTGNDIKEKKLTLPLIYTLNTVDKPTRRRLIYIIKNENKDKQKIKIVIDAVNTCGGIAYATEKMMEYRQKAKEILHSLPENDYRNGLEELVNFIADRKY